MSEHAYQVAIRWTGNRGTGTSGYRAYDRSWDVMTPGKPVIHCSNDPLLGGDPTKANPEELLLAALLACHMLWYLHYASDAGIAVLAYEDTPEGIGEVGPGGAGRFLSATLRPRITLADGSDREAADAIHALIGDVCFIARSVNFAVHHEATYQVAT